MITYNEAISILQNRGWCEIEGSDLWKLAKFIEEQQLLIDELNLVIEQIEPHIPAGTYVALVPVDTEELLDERWTIPSHDQAPIPAEHPGSEGLMYVFFDDESTQEFEEWELEEGEFIPDDVMDGKLLEIAEGVISAEPIVTVYPAPKLYEPTPEERAVAMQMFASMVEIGRKKARAELDVLPPTLEGFKQMINAGSFVVLDTETTGLPKYNPNAEICQIAIVDSAGNTLLDTLVKPRNMIPADATAIHGITNDMVATAPTWADVVDLVDALISTRHVVVYNATFDRQMMHKSAEQWDLPKREWKEISRFWCAMEMFAQVYGEYNSYHGNYKWQTLSTAACYYDLVPNDAHTALGDCITTLAVVKAMAAAKA